jgi:hypothetical protein
MLLISNCSSCKIGRTPDILKTLIRGIWIISIVPRDQIELIGSPIGSAKFALVSPHESMTTMYRCWRLVTIVTAHVLVCNGSTSFTSCTYCRGWSSD